MWPERSSYFTMLYSCPSVIHVSNGPVSSMMLITIRDSDHIIISGCCCDTDMILEYCLPPLISAVFFQSLPASKIDQCCDVLSPLMKLTILWCKLGDAAALFWAAFIIPTSCWSTLLWCHVYMQLLSALEHPDMTCASVPVFLYIMSISHCWIAPAMSALALVGSWSYVAQYGMY